MSNAFRNDLAGAACTVRIMSTPYDPPATGEEIPDFSKPRKRVAFKIDGDVFDAPPAIPAMILMNYAKRFNANAENTDMEEQLKIMTELLGTVLKPASFERFMARLSDVENPIELDQVQRAIEYLMGAYGMRPTTPPSSSQPGLPSPESGMSSMGDTPDVVSTSPSYV